MDKPVILCLSDDPTLADAVRAGLAHAFTIESTTQENASDWLEHALDEGRPLALVLSSHDHAPFALPSMKLPTSRDPEVLEHAIQQELLTRKLQAMYERAETLESLSDVGVALSGSFDIKEILRTTHQAAMTVASAAAVDVVYLGCGTIHSRPLWYPETPEPVNLDTRARADILASLGRDVFDPDALEASGRQAVPIRYQDEQIGFLFVSSATQPGVDTTRLLSILTLQAATALRNIHLTQERIQFERLSAVGRMIGSVVHDFRGPLTALRGFAGMLTNEKLSSEDRTAYGRYVVEECDRLNGMVSELLEFTRGESFILNRHSVELGSYARALAERMRVQFGDRFLIDLALDFTGPLEMDPQRLERLLWNLATNAVQAMPEGGRLTLRSSLTKESVSEESVVISLEDNGPGIPAEIRHRIFEPFFSYGKSEGFGLGMLIARKIAEAHGGRLEVDTSLYGGTAIRVTLPRSMGETANDVVAAPAIDSVR